MPRLLKFLIFLNLIAYSCGFSPVRPHGELPRLYRQQEAVPLDELLVGVDAP